MPYRKTSFINDYFYHVFNRGVEKRNIFSETLDYERFIDTLFYYQFSNPKPKFSTQKRYKTAPFHKNAKIIDIICYCLMPNHFHLLIRQKTTGGVQEFLRKVLNSYSKYFNTKYKRVGPLFQGEFKDAPIETDEQLLHVSRYIHLNPYVSSLTTNIDTFPYSSYKEFISANNAGMCAKKEILSFFKNVDFYKAFVNDHKEYAKSLEEIKHVLLDKDNH